ncbi:Inhibitor of growth protein, partial [Caligus rogercresseyi]
LEDRQKSFFSTAKRLRPSEREEELSGIRREYKKVGEEASEKISIAEDCYSLLDQELHKFKLELEADNRGITEVLEKRSLEMDAPPTNALKENRLPKK